MMEEPELTAKRARLLEIEARMRQLSAKKERLFREAVGYHLPTTELNAVCHEYAMLDLEKYELERG